MANDEQWNLSDNDEADEETTNVATSLLIAIDTDAAMFENDVHGMSTFKNVLHSCYEILDGILLKIGRGKKSIVAIAAVSDDREKVPISEFNDKLPETLQKLKGMCNKRDKELKDVYMRTEPLDMSGFLLHCKRLFTQCNMENLKYIVYITKSDNPVMDDEDKKFHSVNQAKTLNELNIFIELLTFNPNFDYSVYFDEFLLAAESKFNYEYFENFHCMREKLLSMIIYKGRKMRFYPFREIGNDDANSKSFEVIERSYIRHVKILNNVMVTKKTNKEVRKVKTGGIHTNMYKVKYSKGRYVMNFTAAERETLMYDGVPVGFVLLSVISKLSRPGMHITDPKFIQASRKDNLYFDLFWQYCVDKNRMLLCAKKIRTSSRWRLVELSPKVINGVRSFLVLGIAFQENIEIMNNIFEEEKKITCDEKELHAAEEFVKSLKCKYNPAMFHNLAYCKKREYVRSQLLGEPPLDVHNSVDKKVVIKEEDISEVASRFKELCLVQNGGSVKKRRNATDKRKNISDGSRAKSKKKI